MASFRLRSSDDEVVELSAEALKQSIRLRTMIEGTEMESSDVEIPLENVDGETARKIAEWCEKHKTDPVTEPEVFEEGPKPSPFDMPRWDREFLSKETVTIHQMAKLITASNYLGVTWLYKYCCKRIFMDYIRDRSVDQLKAMFVGR
ncbi:hypothetical protein QR680_006779 [Steinernema hermaphroditum]|uniref:Skp1-related protein n=1 Tax=Steinernema hermaphroditum TaxID=289476 RepID=A0AA39HXQ8_9BILA|nr:hypothetical protein QR680_006779 [Steinernema hermaphroditum]